MRKPDELIAGLGRYLLATRRGEGSLYRHARTAARNMKRSTEKLLSEQLAALCRIVDHAYHNSRYYQKRFTEAGFRPGDIRHLSDMRMLPELTKKDLIENMDSILCLPKGELLEATTGGTTGIPLTFYRDRYCSDYRRGIDLTLIRYYGWRDGQWQGWLWGAAKDLLEPSNWKSRLTRYWGERQYFLDVSNLDNESYQKFISNTKRYRPTYVSAYPSIAYDLSKRIEDGECDPVRIPVISLTAEPTYAFQRQKIGEVLADNVYERYAVREYGTAAFECPEHDGLHIFTESVFLETTPAETGTVGQSLLVTDLLNVAMPLIRYHSGDFAELDSTPCPCGLPSPRLKNIQGREVDIIWRPNGTGVAGLKIVGFVRLAKINAQVQIVQTAIDEIIIRLAGKPEDFRTELDELIRTLTKNIGSDLHYHVQPVDEIERAPSGKYQYVISHVARPGRKQQQ